MSAEIIEIILYTIIALFVIGKLRAVLGAEIADEEHPGSSKKIHNDWNQSSDEEMKSLFSQQKSQGKHKTIELQEDDCTVDLSHEELIHIINNDDKTEIISNINKIKELYPSFLVKNFLQIVANVYELIIKSFCQQDCQAIKKLCTDKVYKMFEEKINKLKQNNHKQFSQLVTIEKFITNILIKDAEFEITIEFISTQFSYIENEQNAVISGDKSVEIKVSEQFVFTKNIHKDEMKWLISNIK